MTTSDETIRDGESPTERRLRAAEHVPFKDRYAALLEPTVIRPSVAKREPSGAGGEAKSETPAAPPTSEASAPVGPRLAAPRRRVVVAAAVVAAVAFAVGAMVARGRGAAVAVPLTSPAGSAPALASAAPTPPTESDDAPANTDLDYEPFWQSLDEGDADEAERAWAEEADRAVTAAYERAAVEAASTGDYEGAAAIYEALADRNPDLPAYEAAATILRGRAATPTR